MVTSGRSGITAVPAATVTGPGGLHLWVSYAYNHYRFGCSESNDNYLNAFGHRYFQPVPARN